MLMRKDSALSEKKVICAEDLRDKSLILSRQASNNGEIYSWLKTEPSKLNIVLNYDLIYNVSHFVKKGLGYAIALDKLINITGDSELCFRPLYPPVKAELCIVMIKSLWFHIIYDIINKIFVFI